MKTRIARLFRDQRIRFLITGAINTAVGYVLFAGIQFAIGNTVGYVASLILAHLLSSSVAFILYRKFVFVVRGNVLLDYGRFQTVYIMPLLINLLALPALVELLRWNVYVAQAIIVCVSTAISYFGHKFFSFRRGRPPKAESSASAD
ncbi:MAG: GtrA family protein [Candidatus Saccharibacteria bacterium]|nr:GtrA family protein [Microbacteriaceae bacterium]